MKINPLHAIDFYKTDHRRQYPEGTQYVYSNFTPRSAKHAAGNIILSHYDNRVVFFGLQGFIKWFLVDLFQERFFDRDLALVLEEYRHRMDTSLGAGAFPLDHITALHNLGYLPIEIRAVPEGSRVNIGVPMFTIENTNPDFFWLVNYLETVLSNEIWKPCTTATIAHEYRKLLLNYAERTGGEVPFVDIQGHDFSCRGMAGMHDAAVSGAGHLLSFIGTDTVPAIDYLEDYYHGEGMIGTSVPATEHSVMSMGTKEDEIGTFRRLITEIYPKGIVSIVSDTWNFWQVVTDYAEELKNEILLREENDLGLARVVFRPDSGDPVKIIAGDPDAMVGSPQYKGAVQCLWDTFGGSTNSKGFRTLHPRVGVIYGDSITLERAKLILEALAAKGFASDNVVFGIGSYTYQFNTRDTFGFAMKATWGLVDGEEREIFKDPITDDGTKRSLRGRVLVEEVKGAGFAVLDRVSFDKSFEGALEQVFYNGRLTRDETLETIRNRIRTG